MLPLRLIYHCHSVTKVFIVHFVVSPVKLYAVFKILCCHRHQTSVIINKLLAAPTIPVFYYLLPDHLHVFKTLHAADVVHQDVGVGVANASATQIQPLLEDTYTNNA